MSLKSSFLRLLFFCMLSACTTTPEPEPEPLNTKVPKWAKDAIWYQIFVERFRNGDATNDPILENIRNSYPFKFGADWQVTEWTSNWYGNKEGLKLKEFYDYDIQSRRYGGDLQGILDKLDYLEDLGVTAIYFNPLNDAPSLHKFDARNYRHIDIHFGPDPTGDQAIMETEDPLDPTTWKWTKADQLFLKLIEELHARDMKVVVDYSWNHTGTSFWAWKDILEKGADSRFADWYEIESFDDPATESNEFKYTGWAGVPNLPELKKVEVENRVHGKPYKGNLHPEVKQHVFNVSRRWLDPNGDGNFEDGIDGYRMDVADQIGMDFWRDYRQYVRSINPKTLLVGEIWWEKWPDHLMDPRPYVTEGDVFDIVMFYQGYKPARAFFAQIEGYEGAEQLKSAWLKTIEGIPTETVQSMMAMSSSHDAPRLLTSLLNKGKYKYLVKPPDNPDYQTGKPDPETYERTKLFLIYQFTMPGAPQIWAGDEMGMWGGDDPDCRKPLWWDDMIFENETADPFKLISASYEVGFNKDWNDFYKKLINIRKGHPVLRSGAFEFLMTNKDVLVVERSDSDQRIVILFNNANQAVELENTFDLKGTDLLSGAKVEMKQQIVLPPLSARVILDESK